jgi:hypothetical protein
MNMRRHAIDDERGTRTASVPMLFLFHKITIWLLLRRSYSVSDQTSRTLYLKIPVQHQCAVGVPSSADSGLCPLCALQ